MCNVPVEAVPPSVAVTPASPPVPAPSPVPVAPAEQNSTSRPASPQDMPTPSANGDRKLYLDIVIVLIRSGWYGGYHSKVGKIY